MKIQENCGVFGICSKVSCFNECQRGIFNLQHRGQKWGGFALVSDTGMIVKRKEGLIRPLFKEEGQLNTKIKEAQKSIAQVSLLDPQPVEMKKSRAGPFALALNGRITNTEEILSSLTDASLSIGSDAEILAKTVARGGDYLDGIRNIFQQAKGAFSIVLLTPERVYAARDSLGFKPLIIGKSSEGCAVASESVALEKIGMKIIRDVRPGEIVLLEEDGFRTLDRIKIDNRRALCPFEFSYFARVSSIIDGIPVVAARQNMGRALARNDDVQADQVSSIPFSGLSHGEGYHLQSGLPLVSVFEYNRYCDRSWTPDTREATDEIADEKLVIIKNSVQGKRIKIIDDSIFEAAQIRDNVSKMKEKGALEIHVSISAPPIKRHCMFDFPNRINKRLIAVDHTIEEIRKKIGAETLRFNTLEDFIDSIISAQNKETQELLKPEDLCQYCFTGKSPL